MLKIETLNVFYGDIHVLWDIDLEVKKGEAVALIGSNGAGKTTLFKTISGLLMPRSGSIKFLGEDISQMPCFKRVEKGIVHVPEGRRLFPNLTVLENLKLGAYTATSRKYLKDNIEKVYNLFPILKERKNQLAGTLSGGEQQMVAIGRALISRPKIMIFDEPSLGLAPKVVDTIYKVLENLRNEGLTILFAEQYVTRALNFADRAYVMEKGRIILHGTTEELQKNPAIRKAYLGM
jgi:branched-chain amino acid transport system ATP-binding protein